MISQGRFGPVPLISIPASGHDKCRTQRPDRRPHSITPGQSQKHLALRAATIEGGRPCSDDNPARPEPKMVAGLHVRQPVRRAPFLGSARHRRLQSGVLGLRGRQGNAWRVNWTTAPGRAATPAWWSATTELTSNAILKWQEGRKVKWHYIAPGKPMQNGFVESFNGPTT